MATQVERTRTRSQAGAEAGTGAPRAGWAMLAVLLVGQLMCNIDVMVANVAMPSIGRNLHASGASLQLIVGGYTIGYAMLLITGAPGGAPVGGGPGCPGPPGPPPPPSRCRARGRGPPGPSRAPGARGGGGP